MVIWMWKKKQRGLKKMKKSKGFGDTISKIIKFATFGLIKECGGCKKRKNELNKLFPYRDKKK